MLFRERERERERERFNTLNGLFNCGINSASIKRVLLYFISICPLSLSAQTKSNVSL